MDAPHTYRLDLKFRRCAIYVIVCCPLLAVVHFLMSHLFPGSDPWHAAMLYTFLTAVALTMIVPLRWRLIVDDGGVRRRRLFGWDLWSWRDFASGRIEKRRSLTFFDPARPWWRNCLSIDGIAEGERQEIIGVINKHYRLPPPPVLPEAMEIHCGFRRKVEFDHAGIRLTAANETYAFSWLDVQRLHIQRADAVRRDFDFIDLTLPGHDIEIKGSARWMGSVAIEACNEYLLAHVPTAVIAIDIAGERPAHAADVQKTLNALRKNGRSMRVMAAEFALIILAICILIALDAGAAPALGLGGLATGGLLVTAWSIRRSHRGRIMELEKWLAELENQPKHHAR